MAIELVNGHSGSAHVSGTDVGRLYAAVFGGGSYAIGGEASFSMSDANTLALAACDLMVDGMHVAPDGTDEWKVDSGATGRKRRDLACLHYTMDADTGVEAVEAAVLKGEATTGSAADPDVPSGARSEGSSEAWYPVARVSLDGLTPTAESLLGSSKTLEELAAEVKSASDNADYVKPAVLYENGGGGVVAAAALSETAAAWRLVATEWLDDMGRCWTQLHWAPDGRTWNVFCLDTNWSQANNSVSHIYLKWNAWAFNGAAFRRVMSFVWGSDGQRAIKDNLIRLRRVVGLVRA